MPKVLSKEAPGEFSTCWYIYLQEPIQTAQVRVSPELLSLIHLNFHGALSSSNVIWANAREPDLEAVVLKLLLFGNSLVDQWAGLHAFTAISLGSPLDFLQAKQCG